MVKAPAQSEDLEQSYSSESQSLSGAIPSTRSLQPKPTLFTHEVGSRLWGRPARLGDDAVGLDMDDDNIQYLAIQPVGIGTVHEFA